MGFGKPNKSCSETLDVNVPSYTCQSQQWTVSNAGSYIYNFFFLFTSCNFFCHRRVKNILHGMCVLGNFLLTEAVKEGFSLSHSKKVKSYHKILLSKKRCLRTSSIPLSWLKTLLDRKELIFTKANRKVKNLNKILTSSSPLHHAFPCRKTGVSSWLLPLANDIRWYQIMLRSAHAPFLATVKY